MPPVVAAVAGGLIAIGIGPATAAIIASVLVGIISNLVLNFASSLIFGTPKAPSLDKGRTFTFREPVQARRILYGRARVGGTIVYVETTSINANNNNDIHLIVVVAAHEVEEIGDCYFGDEVVLPGSGDGTSTVEIFEDFAWFIKHSGRHDQAADSDLMGRSDNWTSQHRLRGLAYVYVRLRWTASRFPNGVPPLSFIVKGRKVWDPRDVAQDPDDPDTWEWSDNAALCKLDYIRGCPMIDGSGSLIRPYGIGATDDEIDLDAAIAAANACEETVTLAAGGTEKRYTCNGIVEGGTARDNLQALNTADGGRVVYAGGKWRMQAGAYPIPTVTLTEADARGPITIQARASRRELFNGVKGVYIAPINRDQPSDYPPVRNALYRSQDNDEEIWREYDLPFTATPSMAQRLAKIELEKARQQITVKMPCKLTVFRVQAGDTVLVTNTRMGWSAKPFDVTDWSLAVFNESEVGVDLTLRETASAVYDWNSGEETEVDPAPDTNLPSPWVVDAPSGLMLDSGTDQLLAEADGTIISRIKVSWDMPSAGFLSQYRIEWKLSSDPLWVGRNIPGEATQFYISPVLDGAAYDVRLVAINTLGASSDPAEVLGHTVIGKTEAPAPLADFRLVQLADGTRRFSWEFQPGGPEADVLTGGGVVIAYERLPSA